MRERRVAQREVRGRVHEQLKGEIDPRSRAAIRHERRERSAGRVAADRHARPVASDVGRVVGDPLCCGETVLDASGRPMLGRQPIVDGQHERARPVRQGPAGGSAVSRSPRTKPPPWNHTSTGSNRSERRGR
jgi:hypothetical protein